jgi:cytochrome c
MTGASRSAVIALAGLAAAAIGVTRLAAQAPAGDAANGAMVFDDRCSACHVLSGVGQGPSLIGVVGRKAASLPGYSYSDALTASGLVWTPANLDQFLVGPTTFVPGTSMRAIVSNPADRRDLIAYLASWKP